MSFDRTYREGGATGYVTTPRPSGGPTYPQQAMHGHGHPGHPAQAHVYPGHPGRPAPQHALNQGHQDRSFPAPNQYGDGSGLGPLLTDNQGASGNAYRDAWLAERDESELRRLEALAASEGIKLQPATILRPILIPASILNFVGGTTDALEFYFPFYAYVRKITSSVRHLEFAQNQAPDAATLGQLDVREYIKSKIVRSSGEQLFSDFVSLDQVSGDGAREYVFDLIPFVTRAETLVIQLECDPRVATIDEVQITLHCMRFPVEGV